MFSISHTEFTKLNGPTCNTHYINPCLICLVKDYERNHQFTLCWDLYHLQQRQKSKRIREDVFSF